MTLEEKEYYLMLPAYRVDDIHKMLGGSYDLAKRVKRVCVKEFDGKIEGRPLCVTAKSFWLYMGSSLEEELRLIGIAKGYGKKE